MKRLPLVFITLSLGFLIFTAKAYVYERDDGRFKVYFLDVGQGDAIYARTPRGKDLLIDGGPSKVLLRRLAEVMPWYDRSIDVVIATHPDADHIGGFPDLLKRYRVVTYYHSGVESENAIDDEVLRLLDEKKIPVEILSRGQRLDFRDGVHFDVLYPEKEFSKNSDTNSFSIVGTLSYGSSTIMLSGDAPSSVENRLILLDPKSVRAQVLKAGHHGSKTSSSETFLKDVLPEFTIISSGANNRYKHPSGEVLERFAKLGIKVFRTDELGTIQLFITKNTIEVRN
jgi:competence protein ComEC